jgi:hypothetical protein
VGEAHEEKILRKKISRLEPVNLVVPDVRRRSTPRLTNARLVTSSATNLRFIARKGEKGKERSALKVR